MRKLRGKKKLANRGQPFLDQSSPNLAACRGVPVDWQVSFRLLISCCVAEMCLIKVQSRSQKAAPAHQPVGVNAQGSSELAQGCYAALPRVAFEPTTCWSQVSTFYPLRHRESSQLIAADQFIIYSKLINGKRKCPVHVTVDKSKTLIFERMKNVSSVTWQKAASQICQLSRLRMDLSDHDSV